MEDRPVVFAFGDFEADEALRELRRKGRPVDLHATPLRLLLYLLRHRDRVVSKDELLDRVWSDAVVSDGALSTALKEIRNALGDDGSQQRVIQTLRGRGYRLIAPVEEHPSTPPGRAHPPRAGVPDFVGRSGVFAELDAALEEAEAGRGRIVLLAGEAGIGKTRTAEEFAATVRSRGFSVHSGWCREGKGAPPYWPWVQILRGLVDGRDADTLRSELGSAAARIARIVPEIRERLPDLPETPVGSDAGETRFELFDAAAGFLNRASERETRILIVDDLHWAGASSLQLLEFLALEIGAARILLLGTYRDTEVDRDHPLAGSLAELARGDVCTRVPLEGLQPDEVRELVRRLAGFDPPAELVAEVLEKTDGNPLFIRELASLLSERGAEARPGDTPSRELEVPAGVREVIRGRLQRVSSHCTHALETASVVGREFSMKLLKRAAELDPERLAEALDEARREGFVGDTPEGGFRFAHALTREAVYVEQTPILRARLHGRVGEALERICAADPGPHLADLARHFSAAGDAEKALDYAMRAGHRAMDQLAFDEAASLFQSALRAFDQLEGGEIEERGELLLALARARRWNNDAVAAKRVLADAAAAGRASGCRSLVARAALERAGAPLRLGASDPEVNALLEEALEGLTAERDPALRARLLSRLGAELCYSDPSRAVGLLDEALASSRELADDATLARVLFERSIAIESPDEVEESLALSDELLRLAVRMDDDALAMLGHRGRANYLLIQGEMTALDQEIEAVRQLLVRRATPPDRALIAALDGMRALLEGRFVQAEPFARRSLELALRHPDPASLAKAGGQLAVLFLQSEQIEKLGDALGLFDARFPDLLLARCGRARFECAADRPERARGIFETLAARAFLTIPRDGNFLFTMALLAEVCQALGDTHRGAELYEMLRPYHALNSSLAGVAFYGSVSHHLGGLAIILSDPTAGATHFEEALTMHNRMGARPWLAHTQHDFARLLLNRGEASDRDRALQLASDASGTAREFGMANLAERAKALQQEIQGAIPLRARRSRSR